MCAIVSSRFGPNGGEYTIILYTQMQMFCIHIIIYYIYIILCAVQ